MSVEDQHELIGRKVAEHKETKARLSVLIERATELSRGVQEVASQLRHEATEDEPATVIPVGGKPKTMFITEKEFDSLLNDLRTTRSELTGIRQFLAGQGVAMTS